MASRLVEGWRRGARGRRSVVLVEVEHSRHAGGTGDARRARLVEARRELEALTAEVRQLEALLGAGGEAR